MKAFNKVAIFYFITGIILSLYVVISQSDQILNIGDTYFVFLANGFAIGTLFIFLLIGIILLVIGKFINYKFKISQFLMFSIPFAYFIFSDILNHRNPGYYLAHPIAFQWETVYVPVALLFIFLISLVLFISFIAFSGFKMVRKNEI